MSTTGFLASPAEAEALQTRGLDLDALAVLDAVEENSGATYTELARSAGLSLEAVGAVVNRLERDQLVRIHGLITPQVSSAKNGSQAASEQAKV